MPRYRLDNDCDSVVVTSRLSCKTVAWLESLGFKGLSSAVRETLDSARASAAQEGDAVAEVGERPAVGEGEVEGGGHDLDALVGIDVDITDVRRGATDSLGGAEAADDGVTRDGQEGRSHE